MWKFSSSFFKVTLETLGARNFGSLATNGKDAEIVGGRGIERGAPQIFTMD